MNMPKNFLADIIGDIATLFPDFECEPIALRTTTQVYEDTNWTKKYDDLYSLYLSIEGKTLDLDVAALYVYWVGVEISEDGTKFLRVDVTGATDGQKFIPISELDEQIEQGLWRLADMVSIKEEMEIAISELP